MQTKTIVVGGVLFFGAAAVGAAVWFSRPAAPAPVIQPKPVTPPVRVAVAEPQIPVSMPDVSNRPDGFGPDARFEDFEARLAQFDKDGDGKLSDEERRAMAEAMRNEWRARMDKNGDGVIDEDERLDAMLASPRGRRLMEDFDKNGDGMIDDLERQAIKDDMAAREAQREQQRVERWDADGDGVLSEAELAAEQAARQQQEQERADRFHEMALEFDADGDGELNADERAEAFQTMRDRREIDAFVRRYDSDGSGTISTADFNAFLAQYQAGNQRADVNRDGNIDTLDVNAFRDMMARSNNRP